MVTLSAEVPTQRLPPLPELRRPTAPRRPEERSFLPEVQALRAVAVSLVVLYHFWPHRLTGGFVGVDVFFVISGFLITSHLHRELASRGRIRLAHFYARRARRLLPAAVLVLLVTAAVSFVHLPITRWTASATEMLASTFYVQNWVLADRAVDYSASGAAATPVQHFWSLSVEEQFYLGWPPLILLLLLLARRLPAVGRDRLLLGGILAVTALSLAYSVVATATDPAAAYFVTPARIWELGAGAALALWLRGRGARPRHAAPGLGIALRWVGLAAVLGSAVTLSAASAFPGYIALVPVLGTVAIIAAGDAGRRDPLLGVAGWRPVQFLGDVSYSLYLWHWPVIVLAAFVLPGPLGTVQKLLLLETCVVLAWLTRTFVEQPSQSWRVLRRPARTALSTVVAMLVVSLVAGLQWYEVERQEDAALTLLAAAQAEPCFGAAARLPGAYDCGDVFRAPASLARLPEDAPWFGDTACPSEEGLPISLARCRYGDAPPTRKVALVGDSHAEHWRGALHRVAELMNWEVVEMFRGGCAATSARVLDFRGVEETDDCARWGQQVSGQLAVEQPDAVFTSSWALAMNFDDDPVRALELGSQGFADTWTGWVAATDAQVFVLRDIPTTGDVDAPACLAANPGNPLQCARPRAEALVPDAMTVAAERVGSDRISLIDLSDFFCDDTTCYAAVGGAPVYYDFDHMSAQFSRSLAPILLDRIGGGLG